MKIIWATEDVFNIFVDNCSDENRLRSVMVWILRDYLISGVQTIPTYQRRRTEERKSVRKRKQVMAL